MAEKKSEQIVFEEFENDTDKPLDPSISHALFLSGKEDKRGDLVNKLALINIETMKMVKNKSKASFI